MTPAQLQQAETNYEQRPEFQNGLHAVQDKLTGAVHTLNSDIGQLNSLPQDLLKSTGVRNAEDFAAKLDPTIFQGKDADEALPFWIEAGDRFMNMNEDVIKAYVAGNILHSASKATMSCHFSMPPQKTTPTT